MASKSRIAKDTLAGLEKDSAPFEEQLAEAAKFIGADFDTISGPVEDLFEVRERSKAVTNHGREEWLLRWLLKKLQSPKDGIPRNSASSWRIFCYLIRTMPLLITARILVEGRFISTLRQTLEDIKDSSSSKISVETEEHSQPGSTNQKNSSKNPKKRKRSGELVEGSNELGELGLHDLLASILAAMNLIVQFTKPISRLSREGRSAAFSAEYMKTVIRTSAEDAAKILGIWLSLLQSPNMLSKGNDLPWLSPFIEIWQSRMTDETYLMQFSLHCTLPLLSLLRLGHTYNNSGLKVQLEQLVARNILIPAKLDKAGNPESELLGESTRLPVVIDSCNAAHLFEVAIRSTQPHVSKRRKPQDDAWLQAVFTTLKDAMPPTKVKRNLSAIDAMVQSAKRHKVIIDLPILRSVTAEFALPVGELSWEHWDLLSMIIKLDANVFLIPNEEQDLLKELLKRITNATVQLSWLEHARHVVEAVLIPLMNEFAKARDLSGFTHHWYTQLAGFGRLRKEAPLFSMGQFSAWEDITLQRGFSKLMEASLTSQQILHILDWLAAQTEVNPDAVCVILEAIAGSVSREEVVDAVGLRCYHIMFDNGVSEKLDSKYKWRSWRIISQSLCWVTSQDVDAICKLWEEHTKPFDSFYGEPGSGGLLDISEGNLVGLEAVEKLRTVCAAWSTAREGSQMYELAKPVLLDLLQRLGRDIELFPKNLLGNTEMGDELCGTELYTLDRGLGWMTWSSVQCVFVEYPKVLILASELKDGRFREMLQHVFWVASAGSWATTSRIDWLGQNNLAFSDLWTSSLLCDDVLNSPAVIEMMVDVMLENGTNVKNPISTSEINNAFAIQSLLKLPLSILHRRYRERILKGWLPHTGESPSGTNLSFGQECSAVGPAVLALKVKIMQHPMFYEEMKFQNLVDLADALGDSAFPNSQVSLALFKDLVRLTIEFIFTNADAIRNKEYLKDSLRHMQKKVKKAHEKSKHKWNHASITLFEVTFTLFNARSAMLEKQEIFNNKDLEKTLELFKDSLLLQLQSILQKHSKEKTSSRKSPKNTHFLLILSIIDALATLGIDPLKLMQLRDSAQAFARSVNSCESDVGKKLEMFMTSNSQKTVDHDELAGDPSTIYGRQSIAEKTRAALEGKDYHSIITLLKTTLENGVDGLTQLEKLLTARHIIISIQDGRKSADDEENEDENEGRGFDLSTAYSILCVNLWKATGLRQFCIISETMELMLRTKGRSISQWNIDSTLGSISILCSSNGPALRSNRASTIYSHLCSLLRTILSSHRLKLEGHFHLLTQALQALLRCLFTPLPHSSVKLLKHYRPPAWLGTTAASHQLSAKHATAFTRLVTLICDPSVSSVTRSQHNNLTSATDKAKRMAGQHMQFVLMTYIKLQLEMKMLPEVREKMIPGLYAIFDTTTVEGRRMINDGLDASGRAVFGVLYRDYIRFGKWKGS